MKAKLLIIALSVCVWGCAKKISPNNSGTATASTTAPATTPVDYNTGAGKVPPVENTAPSDSKTEVTKERSAEDNAIATGQSIYIAKCGKCHGLKVTTDYTAERWTGILNVMAGYAKLTETEKANVYAYVKANAKK